MSEQIKNDFIVETRGHCFICLDEASPQFSAHKKSEKPRDPLHSLQCFTRYLKMDMSTVFVQEGSSSSYIPPDLLANVRKSKLKVELCEECLSINNQMTELYRQREKIEMRLASCLKPIVPKLEKAANILTMMEEGKLQVVEALRKEALQNCVQNLKNSLPSVHIQNLTTKDVQPITRGNLTREGGLLIEKGDIKSEQPDMASPDLALDNDDDGMNDFTNDDSQSGEAPTELENKASNQTNLIAAEGDDDVKGFLGPSSSSSVMVGLGLHGGASAANQIPKCKINQTTGQLYCELCLRIFKNNHAYQVHYRSIHLRLRYECNECKKQFHHRSHFERHNQVEHMRGKLFVCKFCHKGFTLKSMLVKHLQTAHLNPPPRQERQFECHFCSETFVQACTLNRHVRENCPVINPDNPTKFECDICNETFMTLRLRSKHYERVHDGKQSSCEGCHQLFSSKWYIKYSHKCPNMLQ